MERPDLIAAVRRFCDDVFGAVLRAEPGAPSFLLERSPTHSNHVALIREIYPDAHIVHIIRDGRDVVPVVGLDDVVRGVSRRGVP